ncbi:MAG TPA: sulfurtransferase TusA family protein [Gammaproteobacteria bacterium]|nr:sulfurtransferase TusA family protein [Gammaproteobacteria bacterium]
MSEQHLDARRLLCPLPVIRVQNTVATLAAGDILQVVCSDPGALHDVPAWCRVHGHRVLAAEQRGDEVRIRIEVVAQEPPA